jgi:hypothetical protein
MGCLISVFLIMMLIDLDKKKMSFCSNGSEAANKSGKNSTNHLELLNCLKQKELEILKAQKISERKNGEKLLSNILFNFVRIKAFFLTSQKLLFLDKAHSYIVQIRFALLINSTRVLLSYLILSLFIINK